MSKIIVMALPGRGEGPNSFAGEGTMITSSLGQLQGRAGYINQTMGRRRATRELNLYQ